MFKTRRKTKITLTLLAAVTLVGVGMTAVGYWSGTGGGGSASLLVGSTAVTVNTDSLVSPISATPQTLSGSFTNQSNAIVTVTSVTATLGAVTRAVGAVGACSAADFTLAGTQTALQTVTVTLPAPVAIAIGAIHSGAWAGVPIALLDSALVDQSGCKGASVTVNYVTS